MSEPPVYIILDHERDISGKIHRLVERQDGFRFYLDPVFLHVLTHLDCPDRDTVAIQMGAEPDEIPIILRMLGKAGLILEESGE